MTEKKDKKEDLPKLKVPDKYQPLENVSVDRKNEKHFRDFQDSEED